MWDREVVCLPKSYMDLFNCDGVLPIPRKKKNVMAYFGLVGKLHLELDWSLADVVSEIKTTFSDVMKNDDFKFLQFTGTGTKSLMILSLCILPVDAQRSCWPGRQAHILVVTNRSR